MTALKAEQFHALHVRGNPLVLFNVWDPGSAKAVTAAGAKAIATGSWSVAHAHGFEDGEKLPLAMAIDNLRRIVSATSLPVSIDLESGYGDTVGEAVRLAIDAGAVGCNLEDSFPGTGRLRTTEDQCDRIRIARKAADGLRFFINVRTDVFFATPREQHAEPLVDEVLRRARAYAEADADGLFVPGLVNIDWIARVAQESPLPLNVMVSEGTPPLRVLAEHGVARVSHAGGPYRIAMKALEDAARAAIG